jgi:hypothetical protein
MDLQVQRVASLKPGVTITRLYLSETTYLKESRLTVIERGVMNAQAEITVVKAEVQVLTLCSSPNLR